MGSASYITSETRWLLVEFLLLSLNLLIWHSSHLWNKHNTSQIIKSTCKPQQKPWHFPVLMLEPTLELISQVWQLIIMQACTSTRSRNTANASTAEEDQSYILMIIFCSSISSYGSKIMWNKKSGPFNRPYSYNFPLLNWNFELAINGGSCGRISLKRGECHLRLKRLAPSISLSCKLVAVQYREYEYGPVAIVLMPTSIMKICHESKEIQIEKSNTKPCETCLFLNILTIII